MALIRIDTPIEIEISDLEFAGTILKRKAEFFTLIYNMKVKTLTVTWEIKYYAKNEDGSYGERLDIRGLQTYSKDLIADNSTYVNPVTGEIVEYNEDIDMMTQYEWYNQLAENQNVNIHDLIRASGLQAVADNRF